MASFEMTLGGATEARFKSEAVYQIELSPHHNTCRGLSRFLDLEGAVLVAEHLTIF